MSMFGNKNHPTDTNREEKLQNKVEDLEAQIKSMNQASEERARRVRMEKEDTQREHEQEVQDLKRNATDQLNELEQTHKLALKQQEFDMKNYKDGELQKAREELAAAELKFAVAELKFAVVESENKGLRKLVEFGSEFFDVKEMISGIIAKLPTVNINALGGAVAGKSEKKE